MSLRPFFDFVRARGSAPFAFQAPDESFGFAVWNKRGFAVGTALGLAGRRTPEDVGAPLPKVGYSLEIGGFVQHQVTDNVRLRAEVRRGIGGHEGWIGDLSADLVARDKDIWLFSVGPRVTVSDDRYQDAYFSVAPLAVAASGLPAFDADGGVQAVGVTAGFLRQLTPRWGMAGYARYDRLVGDAGASPIVRRLGSRNQMSGGVALTYTFGRFAE